MNLKDINKNHPSYGKIHINSFNGGTENLFGQRKTNSGAISIEFHQASIMDMFGDLTRITSDKMLYKIEFTAEQWSEILLNKNSESGTPVTIRFGEKGAVEKPEIQSNDNVFEKYTKDISKKFSGVFSAEKEATAIMSKDKVNAADKKQIMEIFRGAKKDLFENKNYLENRMDAYLTDVEKTSEERFVKGLKKNLLGIEDTKLIEGPKTETIKEDYMGVLILKSLTNLKGTIIKDYEANNGVSLTLYRAEMKRDGENETITRTDEKLIEVRMSNSQFSQFIISFGKGDLNCTIANRLGEEFQPLGVNINDETEDIQKLYEHIDEIEKDTLEMEAELETLLSKPVSKERKKETLFVFEKMSRLVGVDFRHYAKRVFDSGLKYSIRRQEDVQSGIIDQVHKDTVERIKNNPESLENMEGKMLPSKNK